jgi:hypothetical protein
MSPDLKQVSFLRGQASPASPTLGSSERIPKQGQTTEPVADVNRQKQCSMVGLIYNLAWG